MGRGLIRWYMESASNYEAYGSRLLGTQQVVPGKFGADREFAEKFKSY